ncbi:MAG: hypothetical protein K5829_06300 [Treponema sp.]|nr:hypothetical protein [Treponema sp.]
MSNQNISKKKVVVVIISIVILLALTGLSIFLVSKKKNSSFDVGFYQLPENISTFLEKKVTQLYTGKIEFHQLEDADLQAKKIEKKYDIIFCQNGAIVDSLKEYTKKIPASLYSNMPRAIADRSQVTLPLLLDHYELSYYRPSRTSALHNIPQNLDEFYDYLEEAKKKVFTPFFCAGGDDKTLLALVSAYVESYGGTGAYQEFIAAAKKDLNLKNLSEVKLPLESEGARTFTLLDILDFLRSWKEREFVHPEWFNANFNDVKVFLEDKQVGVVFMPLSFHRTISYKVIRDFESDRFPLRSPRINHGLIAPEYVAIKFSNDSLCDTIFEELVAEDFQTNLSDQTKLAPINSRCAAFDRQADDVRFLAAACKDGPIAPMYEAVFMPDEEAAHKFAEDIRSYLKFGVIN